MSATTEYPAGSPPRGTSVGIRLPTALRQAVREAYRAAWRLEVRWLNERGQLRAGGGSRLLRPGTVSDAFRESVRWGEPYVFFSAPGVLDWVVPLCDGDTVAGGLLGGGVLVDESDRTPATAHLPVWPADRPRQAAQELYDLFYRMAGWSPVRLVRNREQAAQQRQVAEAIQRGKESGQAAHPLEQERMLLSLIRVGDRKGARRLLNQLLAGLFLHSPDLAVLRARAMAFLGYLVRTAVEDNPLLESLLTDSGCWIERVLAARDFESLCEELRRALDAYFEHIALQGFNRTNPAVRRALDYLASHFSEPLRLAAVARAAGLSVHRLAHVVKDSTGRTVMQHVRRLRIQHAQKLLEEGVLDGASIAVESGFHDQSHLTRQFQAALGTTPGRYRRGRR